MSEKTDRNYLMIGHAEWQVMLHFREFAKTIKDKDVERFFDGRNRDEYIRSFGEYLVKYRPEFASND